MDENNNRKYGNRDNDYLTDYKEFLSNNADVIPDFSKEEINKIDLELSRRDRALNDYKRQKALENRKQFFKDYYGLDIDKNEGNHNDFPYFEGTPGHSLYGSKESYEHWKDTPMLENDYLMTDYLDYDDYPKDKYKPDRSTRAERKKTNNSVPQSNEFSGTSKRNRSKLKELIKR